MNFIIIVMLIACQMAYGDAPPSKPSTDKAVVSSKSKKVDKTGCKYEVNCECESPGDEVRWELQYCKVKMETDDCETAMMECKRGSDFQTKLKGLNQCQRNRFWHTEVCKMLKDYKKMEDCLKQIPPFIASGC